MSLMRAGYDMPRPLSDFQRVFLLLVWLGAFAIIVVLGFDPRMRYDTGGLVEAWRLFVPLIAAGLVTLLVHLSNRMN